VKLIEVEGGKSGIDLRLEPGEDGIDLRNDRALNEIDTYTELDPGDDEVEPFDEFA
jgi:hypothetical protein